MKLMDQVRDAIGKKHYSIRTEAAYVKWIKDFHGVCHLNDMKEEKIAQYIFLSYHGSPSCFQHTESSSMRPCYLNKHVLRMELRNLGSMERGKKPQNLPVVMTQAEVSRVLSAMQDIHELMARLLCMGMFLDSWNVLG